MRVTLAPKTEGAPPGAGSSPHDHVGTVESAHQAVVVELPDVVLRSPDEDHSVGQTHREPELIVAARTGAGELVELGTTLELVRVRGAETSGALR